MRSFSKASLRKPSPDSQRLINLSRAILQAGSRLEQRAWEQHLDLLLARLLKSGHQKTLDGALDRLFTVEPDAYDVLMDAAEAGSEACVIEHDGTAYDTLLVALPILAWTRYAIPSGPVPAEILGTLGAHLHAHVLADDARAALAPTLFSIDQLPRSHAEILALTQRMAQAALKGEAPVVTVRADATAPFLADTRYLLAAVVVPAGQPLFRWQTDAAGDYAGQRAQMLQTWRQQAEPNVARLLPGCSVELLLPDAYFISCREADRQIRPASIRAADFYLTSTLGVESQELHASIGAFAETADGRVDEYRIGFGIGQSADIVHGVIWPLYGQEDEIDEQPAAAGAEGASPIEQILALLRECGITRIKHHHERFPMEFCDDCGAPLYPDRDGDLVHPEMPEDAPAGSGHFH